MMEIEKKWSQSYSLERKILAIPVRGLVLAYLKLNEYLRLPVQKIMTTEGNLAILHKQ